jgi:hypothetical protein
MPEIPTAPPSSHAAGDTLAFSLAVPAYADGTWAFAARLVGEAQIDASTAALTGTTLTVTWTAAQTAGLPPGTYTYAVTATAGAERYTVARGSLVITPNLAVVSGDQRSADEVLLAAIDARIAGRFAVAGQDLSSFAVAGRSVTLLTLDELRRARAAVASRVIRARTGGMLPSVEVTIRGA